MKIGMAGTGRMGAAIAQRLAGRGHQVTVWNRTADKARALGLPVAEDPAGLLEASEIVISILTDASAIEAVYSKLLSGDVRRKLFIEMSTVRPETQKKLRALRWSNARSAARSGRRRKESCSASPAARRPTSRARGRSWIRCAAGSSTSGRWAPAPR